MTSKAAGNDMTVDELIATLKRSSLPTVLTEGGDDIIVFRWMEKSFTNIGLSVLAVGGRDKLLQLFSRRNEYENETGVAFIADKDSWVFGAVPAEYEIDNLIFTWGYSIENDLYSDGDVERILSNDERHNYKIELQKYLKWYALAISRFLAGLDQGLGIHPNEILDNDARMQQGCELLQNEIYPDELFGKISDNYVQMVRGKSLFALLMRHLSYAGRPVRHNHKSIIEIVASAEGPLMKAIYGRIGDIFGAASNTA
ncbi:hypothetical protein NKI82_28555 [Mesorhizobium sp. M0482]|uniref:hypothetical protein n=1 Tax=Mesorhizobium sp. M0482 TaxID=2956948 RepID=UPI003335FCF3